MGGAKWHKIENIGRHPDLQPRASIPERAVAEYTELLLDAIEANDGNRKVWPFDTPVIVYRVGGEHLLTSGWTRLEAAKGVGLTEVRAEVRDGEWIDALADACGANARHGYRRTPEDKRRAVELILREVTDGDTSWADSRVAAACACSPHYVASVRGSMVSAKELPDAEKRLSSDGREFTRSPNAGSGFYDRTKLSGNGSATPTAETPQAASEPEAAAEHTPDAEQAPGEQTVALGACPSCDADAWTLGDGGYLCTSCGRPHGVDENETDWEDVPEDAIPTAPAPVESRVVDGGALRRAIKSLSTLTRAAHKIGLPVDGELRTIHEHLQACEANDE